MRRNRKLKTLKQLILICARLREQEKTYGLITGCFDVIHTGHVNLIRFAKLHCGVVIVGLDSDGTLTKSKGLDRPKHTFKERAEIIGAFEDVDYTFLIDSDLDWNIKSELVKQESVLAMITKALRPNFLVTNPAADRFWKRKEARAKSVGAKLLKAFNPPTNSSSIIAEKLRKQL